MRGRTSKMSHAHGGHDSCGLRFGNRRFHSILPSLAGGMTDVGVGSGALFGATQRWKTPENKSVVLGEITRRLLKSLGLQDSMTSEFRDRKGSAL